MPDITHKHTHTHTQTVCLHQMGRTLTLYIAIYIFHRQGVTCGRFKSSGMWPCVTGYIVLLLVWRILPFNCRIEHTRKFAWSLSQKHSV